MQTEIEPREMEVLRRQLQERLSALMEDFRRELDSQEHQGYGELSAQVRDLGDEAAADVLMESRLFDIQRDDDELREVRKALTRMQGGSYGVCVDCGEPIPETRLRAQPTASRCLHCQKRFELDYRRVKPREF